MVQLNQNMTTHYKLRYLLAFALGITILNVHAQPLSVKWAKQVGGTISVNVLGSTTNSNGDIYLCGYFSGTVDFDPGLAQLTKTVTGGINADIFIQKLDANGNLKWINTLGTTSTEYAYAVTVDGSGNVYVTGRFNGTMDFDPGIGTFNLTAPGSTDAAYILKLDENGLFKWARACLISGTGFAYGVDIVADADNSPIMLGYYMGTLDMDPTPGSDVVTTQGWQDPFIVKLDSNGMYTWGKTYGGSGHDYTTGLAIDKNQNLYSCGYFENTVDFDPGPGIHNITTSGSTNKRAFIQKLRPNGDFVWVAAPTGGSSQATAIAVADDGGVYSGGTFSGTVDLDPGTGSYQVNCNGVQDMYLHKLDTNGIYQWGYAAGSKNWDYLRGVTFDKKGNMYATGSFTDTVDFDPGSGTDKKITNGSYDIFVVGLHADGSYGWTAAYGNANNDRGYKVLVDAVGDLIITGGFSDTVDFDPGAGTQLMVSQGANDMYIVKYDDPTAGIKEFSGNDIGSVYPNPSTGNIRVNLLDAESGIVKIYNAAGQVVYEHTNYRGGMVIQLPQSPGLYLLEVQTQKGNQKFKLIKQ